MIWGSDNLEGSLASSIASAGSASSKPAWSKGADAAFRRRRRQIKSPAPTSNVASPARKGQSGIACNTLAGCVVGAVGVPTTTGTRVAACCSASADLSESSSASRSASCASRLSMLSWSRLTVIINASNSSEIEAPATSEGASSERSAYSSVNSVESSEIIVSSDTNSDVSAASVLASATSVRPCDSRATPRAHSSFCRATSSSAVERSIRISSASGICNTKPDFKPLMLPASKAAGFAATISSIICCTEIPAAAPSDAIRHKVSALVTRYWAPAVGLIATSVA